MKLLPTHLGLALALAAAGCGGAQRADTTPKPSPCAAASTNFAAQLVLAVANQEEGVKQLATKAAPAVARVMAERCEADAWTPAAIDCVTKADVAAMDGCTKQLTAAQQESFAVAMRAEMAKSGPADTTRVEAGATMSAPTEGAPPDDPCGGGE